MILSLLFLSTPVSGFVAVEAAYFGPLPAVAAETSPGKKEWFMLDTGSPLSIFGGRLADGWKGPMLRIGQNRLTVPITTSHDLDGRIGPGSNKDPKAVMGGVFGTDFLRGRQIFFDPYHEKISLRSGPVLDARTAERLLRAVDPWQRGRELVKIGLETMSDGYFGILIRSSKETFRLVFDTGSPFLALRKEVSERASGRKVFTDSADSGANAWLLPDLIAGSYRMPLPLAADMNEEGLDGLIGLSQLARTAIVDLPGRTLFCLQPTSPAALADGALARFVGRPLWRTEEGKLAIDTGPFTGKVPTSKDAMLLVSVQGKPIAHLIGLFRRAVQGDAKAIYEVAAIEQARWKSPTAEMVYRGKKIALTFPIM